MATGRATWTSQRDDLLIDLARASVLAETIAERISYEGEPVTPSAVLARLFVLGVRIARPGYWTPARDALLRQLWAREPRLKLEQIRVALGGELVIQSVSRRAMLLGLPARYAVDQRQRSGRRIRQSRAGEFCAPKSEARPSRRVRVVDPPETPCPYYNPLHKAGCCNVMVDRRIRPNGVKPGPYCAEHALLVLPLPRGSIGTLATYGRERRFA